MADAANDAKKLRQVATSQYVFSGSASNLRGSVQKILQLSFSNTPVPSHWAIVRRKKVLTTCNLAQKIVSRCISGCQTACEEVPTGRSWSPNGPQRGVSRPFIASFSSKEGARRFAKGVRCDVRWFAWGSNGLHADRDGQPCGRVLSQRLGLALNRRSGPGLSARCRTVRAQAMSHQASLP